MGVYMIMIALLLMKPVCSNHTAQQYITTMFPNSPTRVATINTTIVPTTGATSTSHVVERYRDGLIGMLAQICTKLDIITVLALILLCVAIICGLCLWKPYTAYKVNEERENMRPH